VQQGVPNYCCSFVVGYVMTVSLTRYDVALIVRLMEESELESVSKEAVEA